jgi:hypothetical protein
VCSRALGVWPLHGRPVNLRSRDASTPSQCRASRDFDVATCEILAYKNVYDAMMPFRVIVIAVELHGQSRSYLRASLCASATARTPWRYRALTSRYSHFLGAQTTTVRSRPRGQSEKAAAMRLIGVATTVVTLVLAFVSSGLDEAPTAEQRSGRDGRNGELRHEVPRRRIRRAGRRSAAASGASGAGSGHSPAAW